MTKTKLSYYDKLQDPRWQKRRLEILSAAQWACEDCYSTDKTLHVHHCWYEYGREPWEYDRTTLMALCEECHEARQEVERDAKLTMARIFRKLENNSYEVINARTDLHRLLMSMIRTLNSEDLQGVAVVDDFEHRSLKALAESFCEWAGIAKFNAYYGNITHPENIRRIVESKINSGKESG